MQESPHILKEPYTEERASFYQASDVLLLAGEIEGEPSVLSEAMACGLVIIASNISGHQSLVIDGDTGLLFPPGNLDELIIRMQMVNNNVELREYLGTNARLKVMATRDISTISKNIIKLFQEEK